MARWPRTGRGISSLYERTPIFDAMVKDGLVSEDDRETTLARVVADLGLSPLSPDDEDKIRFALGAFIAQGEAKLEDSPKHNKANRLRVADVRKTLTWLGDELDEIPIDTKRAEVIAKFLRGTDTGLQNNHDIAVVGKIFDVLFLEVGDRDVALDLLQNFRTHPGPVANACRRAAKDLKMIKGKPGSSSMDWSIFRQAAVLVAERNDIPTTVYNNPRAGPEGRFIEIAISLERLLPPHMRTGTRDALAKRLHRGR